VFVGQRLALTVTAFAGINLVLALVWLVVVAALNPSYRNQIARAPKAAFAK
jgi:hypothetical protein